ncbi:MAG: hypothetical protein A2Y88_02385 [Chloroflexi bacterium RBG_13_48_10]|nr:MAG: hypothetical protein A2Y88_02385 [Chloroflexi bacterium RBG_13_48_10]
METAIAKKWSVLSKDVDTTTSMLSPEEAQRRLAALREPSNRPPQLHLHLHTDQRSGEIVLRTHDLKIGYPGKVLFCAGDIELRRLQCTALIGPNGAGKTTFLKTILEKIPPVEGEVELGSSLKVGYFAQAHEDLNPERTLVQEIESVAPEMLLAEIRDYLARFLFTGEEAFKPVSVLSGGERGRLALAKLALTGANLLLLDEPTNHLDIPSQEVLQEVLYEYQGTILLVSHDRYLIDALATQIWEIDEGKGTLRTFKGSYSQYHMQQEAERIADKEAGLGKEAVRVVPKKSRITADDRQKRERVKEVEALIDQLEADLAVLSHKLENPPNDAGKVQKLGTEYVRIQKELETLMDEWGELLK